MTQYGYGYGYQQPYGYGQVATTPTVGYTSYQQQQQRMPYSGSSQTSQSAQQATATQPPSVGYSPYTATSAAGSIHQHQHQQHQHQQQARPAQTPTQQYHAPQHQQQKATPTLPPHGTSQVSAAPSYYSAAQQTAQAQAHQQHQQHQHQQQTQAHQAQQAATTGYYGYGTAYRAQATAYSPYYGQQQQQQQQQQQRQATQQSQSSSAQQSSVRSASSGGGGGGGMATSHYTSPAQTRMGGASAAATSGSSMVTYPAYTPTNYYSAYNKQNNQKTGTNATYLTSQQQHVVASYIQQKTKGVQQNFFTKRTPVDPSQYYCEVCKISCACAATYKTHLEGKNHKKRLQQQQTVPKEVKGSENYCELCDVICSNRDAFEAHVRGSKHQKVLTLHRRLGKPIPQINVPSTTGAQTTSGGKTVMVAAPRITFVGGQQLHSTGQTGSTNQQSIKVYPPGSAVTSATPTKPTVTAAAQQKTTTTPTTQVTATPTSQQTTPTPQQSTPVQQQDTPTTTPQDELSAEPVGEQFVVSVKGDPKVPHATYKCELCDCYFNDDYAKKMHVKGRRHRINYKKAYQPDLYIEPTKAQKKELEKKRLKRMARNSTEGYPGPQGGGAARPVSGIPQ